MISEILDEIVSIECVGEYDCIDFVLDGNRLFYANDILTHNCGQNASDFELTEVSESHGLAMTSDSMFGLIVTEDLEKLGQMRVKILKNRYGSKTPSSFVIGMNRAKMTLHDLDKPQDVTSDSVNVSPITTNINNNKSKLSGFKV